MNFKNKDWSSQSNFEKIKRKKPNWKKSKPNKEDWKNKRFDKQNGYEA